MVRGSSDPPGQASILITWKLLPLTDQAWCLPTAFHPCPSSSRLAVIHKDLEDTNLRRRNPVINILIVQMNTEQLRIHPHTPLRLDLHGTSLTSLKLPLQSSGSNPSLGNSLAPKEKKSCIEDFSHVEPQNLLLFSSLHETR